MAIILPIFKMSNLRFGTERTVGGRSREASRSVDHGHRRPPVRHADAAGAGHARGFTLIETALATVIVGVGVLAMVVGAGRRSTRRTPGPRTPASPMRLGNEIREMTFNLPRHDPGDRRPPSGAPSRTSCGSATTTTSTTSTATATASSSRPTDGTRADQRPREIIANMAGWTQIVTSATSIPFDISDATSAADGSTSMSWSRSWSRTRAARTTAPLEMTTVSWIAPN